MPVAGKSLYKTKAVTIDISESTTISTAVDTDGLLLSGIIFPAAMTGTAITFQVASTNTGGTFKALKETDGTDVTYTVTADSHVRIDPSGWAGVGAIKIVSGSAEAADRVINLVFHSA
jgi:hypothetical protein|tara:strand:+ start:4521 stop:4874 length:354 start_codon:yes stop_codon:yes gene_type:complete